MPQHYLMHNQTLIRDPEVFEFNYTPETIHYRDAQLRQLAGALGPALHGACPPVNANLRGPPGTGKTTCVRRIFSELEDAPPPPLWCRSSSTARVWVRLSCLCRHL